MSKIIDKLFNRYKYLINIYSNQIDHNTLCKLSFSKEDIEQELSIKLYKAIRTYGNKWATYRRKKKNKPIQINIYLRQTMKNCLIDFKKKSNRLVPISNFVNVDYGVSNVIEKQTSVIFDIKEQKFILGGCDMLVGLKDNERKVFLLFVYGLRKNKIERFLKKSNINIQKIVEQQRERIIRIYGSNSPKEQISDLLLFGEEIYYNIEKEDF